MSPEEAREILQKYSPAQLSDAIMDASAAGYLLARLTAWWWGWDRKRLVREIGLMPPGFVLGRERQINA